MGIDLPTRAVCIGFILMFVLFLNKSLVLQVMFSFILAPPFYCTRFPQLPPPHGKITIILHLTIRENAIYSVLFPWGGVPSLMFPLSDSVVCLGPVVHPGGSLGSGCHIVYFTRGWAKVKISINVIENLQE